MAVVRAVNEEERPESQGVIKAVAPVIGQQPIQTQQPVSGIGNKPVPLTTAGGETAKAAGTRNILTIPGEEGAPSLLRGIQGSQAPQQAQVQQQAVPSTGAPERGRRSGAFTNFQRIIDANRAQAATLATRVGEQAVGTTQADLAEAVQLGTEGFNLAADRPDVSDEFFNNIVNNPAAIAADPDQLRRARAILSGEISPPAGLSGVDQARLDRAIREADAVATSLGSPGGTRDILSELGRRNQPGRVSFDEFLLTGTPEARANLAAQSERLAPLGEEARTTIEQNIADINQREALQAQEESIRGQRLLSETEQALRDELTGRAREAQDISTNERQEIDLALASGRDLTPRQLELLGISQDELTALRGDPDLRLQDFLRESGEVTAQDVVTQEEAARFQALQNLLGVDPSFITSPGGRVDTGSFDLTDFDLGQAQLAQQSLEIQRLGIPEGGEFVSKNDIGGSRPGTADFTNQVQLQIDRLSTKFNINEDAEFLTDKKKNAEALKAQGYVQIAQLQIKNRDDSAIFVRPGPSGTLLPTRQRPLFDPRTGETISAGSIPLPILHEIQQRNSVGQPPPPLPGQQPVRPPGNIPGGGSFETGSPEAGFIDFQPPVQPPNLDDLAREQALRNLGEIGDTESQRR